MLLAAATRHVANGEEPVWTEPFLKLPWLKAGSFP